MRIKSLFVSLIIILQCASAFAATPPKAGAICAKAGITVSYQSKKYTCIRNGKKLVWDKGVQNKVTASLPTTQPTVSPSPTPSISSSPSPSSTSTPEAIPVPKVIVPTDLGIASLDIQNCRLPDARTKVVQNVDSIAYPAVPWNSDFTSHSSITIAILPFDFADNPGTQSPKLATDLIISDTESWIKWFTHGKLKINWVTLDNWTRINGSASDYYWLHPDGNTGAGGDNGQLEIGKKLVANADKVLDLTKIQEIYFMYPNPIPQIKDSVNFTWNFSTSKGQRTIGVFAASNWLYNNENPAIWLMHENIHRFGYMQHAPAWPPLFSLGASDYALNVDTWDRIVLDWITPEDIYCTKVENLNGQIFKMAPIEREETGTAGVAIKINDHRMLILESHRKDRWSPQYLDLVSGVTAMIVDTSFDTDRSGEWSQDDGRGTKFSRTANYLQFTQYDHGRYPNDPHMGNFELNYLLFPGESFTFEGIKVELLAGGINDYIKVDKA